MQRTRLLSRRATTIARVDRTVGLADTTAHFVATAEVHGSPGALLPQAQWWAGALWPPVLGTALLYLLFIALRLAANGYDPSVFVQAGDLYGDPARVPDNLRLLVGEVGYDGQAYYRLALDPLTSSPTAHGITLDNPPYRQQRILYPLLVWAASLGQPGPVPVMLIVVNLAALCVLAGIGARYSQLLGRSPALGALFACYPGFVLTLANDLTEIVAGTALLCTLLLLRQRRFALATTTLTAAILARETAAVLAAACLLWLLIARLRGQAPAYPFSVILIPLTIEVCWQVFLWMRWGSIPLRGSGDQGNIPLQGFASLIHYISAHPLATTALSAANLLVLGMFTIACLLVFRHTTALPHERLGWLLYVGMAFLLNHQVWLDSVALMRVFTEVYLLGTVLLLGCRWRWSLHAFAAPAISWAGFFVLWSIGNR